MSGLAKPRAVRSFALDRETTPVRIAAALRAEIAKGALPPGTRIQEMEFTAAFDVSRHTLREAISLLVAEGLLTRASFKGVEVTKLSADDVRDIYAMRRLIELAAVDALADAAPAVWNDILAAIDAVGALPISVDSETMNRADLAVHFALVAVYGSKRIMNTYAAAVREMQILLFRAYPPKDVVSGRMSHVEFGQMLRDRDITAARRQLEQRLLRSEQELIAALA